MRIGIDIMGGDYAPEATVKGAISAAKLLDADQKIVLIGNQNEALRIIEQEKADKNLFDFVHTDDVIGMGDHPYKSFTEKQNSSITVGFGLLAKNEIDAFASAGNTGAMMVGAMVVIKSVPGVIRPTIAAQIPKPDGEYSILLDVGLNPDSKPDVLYQYGVIGSIYARNVFNIDKPKVALVNIGSEAQKGNLVTKAAYELMNESREFNFVGNIEGTDLFQKSTPDVLVCDGFVGNVVLKEAEAFYSLIKSRNIDDDFFEQFNFENFGGTPVLGIRRNVIIAHGISNAKAIKNMVLHTRDVITADLPERFNKIFM